MNTKKLEPNIIERPPVVVVMGHVDHGKSTLLDYIRKTNVVADEAGGITQQISAYEVLHKDEHGSDKKITFLDTPGHEAFSKMRARGASAADIAILLLSAEDSVKAQTLEAYNTIIENNVPYIVAINKIDKSNANIDKVKMDLVEKGIYLEGLGGDIPFVPISAKIGTGVDELLDMILLVAALHSFNGDKNRLATGIIIEAHRDPKRGVSATAIIKDGSLASGMFVAVGEAITTTRVLENFAGKPIKEAMFSSPIKLVGFDSLPDVGSEFESFTNKKDAEEYVRIIKEEKLSNKKDSNIVISAKKIVPIILKTDVSGTIEAIEKEIEKLNTTDLSFKIIHTGVGAINESDLKMASVSRETIVFGFNTKIENGAKDLNETIGANIKFFDIIYKLIDFLKEVFEERRPREEQVEVIGSMKVLKIFSATKDKQVIGGKVTTGQIAEGSNVRIIRRENEIGRGKIIGLQMNKIKTKEILEDSECGALVDSKIEIAGGDTLEAFIMVVK